MSISSVAARIAELQTLVHGPPPASSPTPAASGTGGAATTGASFATLLDQRVGGAAATPAAPGTYPGLTGDLDAAPELLARLSALASRRGETFDVTSGGRTYAEQAALYAGRGSNPYPVARPGTSRHESGNAADVTVGGRAIQDVIPAGELRAVGLSPLAGDAVHVELPS